ncbi:MAG TPA: hypothetical protein VFA18_24325 [Gemmataceae bacterium]|nr:hypothetical protein [Gemmataceae bacterium]
MVIPPSRPGDEHEATDSLDSLLVIFDGPGDTTRRPARPNLPPPYWRGWQPPPEQSPADK